MFRDEVSFKFVRAQKCKIPPGNEVHFIGFTDFWKNVSKLRFNATELRSDLNGSMTTDWRYNQNKRPGLKSFLSAFRRAVTHTKL